MGVPPEALSAGRWALQVVDCGTDPSAKMRVALGNAPQGPARSNHPAGRTLPLRLRFKVT